MPTDRRLRALTLSVACSLVTALLVTAPADAGQVTTVAATPALHALSAGEPIALPAGVALQSGQANGLRLIEDEEWVLANVRYEGSPQVGAIRLGRPEFSCVTCGVLDGGREASPFEDGRRVFVAGPAATMSDIQFHVVTCTPSLVDCQERTAKPVTLPRDGLQQGVQNREPRVSPDGRHLTWTEVRATGGPVMVIGELVETARHYRVRKPYVINPRHRFGARVPTWVEGTRYYETGGGWLDGGRTLVYRATSTSMNYDIWELDLATGQRRLVTTDLDYNEIYEGSPDGQLALYASARGLDRMDVFTQLVRPALLDTMTFPQLGRISLHNNRRCMNEHWLMDRAGQRGDYAGQPVVLSDGWVIRGSDWFDDGRRFIVSQQQFSPGAGGATDEGVELRVVEVAGAEATTPTPAVDLGQVGYEDWAIPYRSYRPAGSRMLVARRLAGAHSGAAIVSYAGTFAAGTWSVRYDSYSEDGRTFLDGTELITTSAAPIQSTWTADLRSSGERTGSMRGALSIRYPAAFDGSVRTEIDGEVWEGVPTQQKSCPGVHRPRLQIGETVAVPGAVRVRVVANVPESATPQPVQGATVAGLGRAVVTDAEGWAEVPPGTSEVAISAGGFAPTTAELP
ncbi:hypothetical protein [Nocardioides pelophilus]|uniref:hypothetical protein n=1 Tax=Nocardioides pelophilus TaxID=2172019 RepID=UPI001603923B|nr:hypothetical protein [Nocardioides pelophilus]